MPSAPDRTVLVTGAAGFIGAHAAAALADDGWQVIGCDNFNGYYDPALKLARVQHWLAPRSVPCQTLDLRDDAPLGALFDRHRFSHVLHLAAQAGVRHAARAPGAYVQDNLVAFGHLLEASRRHGVRHFVYSSSSSVYGARTRVPFHEDDSTDQPTSLYAATKRANELMAHAYAHRFGLPSTGLRLFTVYGPWGRPDMAYFSFAERMLRGEPVPLFGDGSLQRDFTAVADVVEALRRLLGRPCPSLGAEVPHAVCNVGNRHPVAMSSFVHSLEAALGVRARVEMQPAPPDDVPITCADTRRLREWTGFEPATPLGEGLARFGAWFLAWHAEREAARGDEAALAA